MVEVCVCVGLKGNELAPVCGQYEWLGAEVLHDM